MQISIKRKLYGIFGMVFVGMGAIGALLLWETRKVDRWLVELDEVQEPLGAAAQRMQAAASEVALKVFTFLATPEAGERDEVLAELQTLRNSTAEHARGARAHPAEESGRHIARLFEAYLSAAETTIGARADETQAVAAAARSLDEATRAVDEQLLAKPDRVEFNLAAKTPTAAALRLTLIELGRSISHYVRTRRSEDRERVVRDEKVFRTQLEQLARPPATAAEQRTAAALQVTLERTADLIVRTLAAVDAVEQKRTEFLELRRELQQVLNERVRLVVQRQSANAKEAARAGVFDAQRNILLMLAGGLFAGGTAALVLSGRVTGAIRKLTDAAHAIGHGQLEYTIELRTGDELETLAAAFNDMARKRRDAEEALRHNEQSLAVTLRSIGDGVLATDVQRRVTRLNAVAEKLTGWSEAEVVGRSVDDVFRIVHKDTREPAANPVADVLATGAMHELAGDVVLLGRDGTARPITNCATPIRDNAGQVTGVVLVFRDATDERRAKRILEDGQAILRDWNARLETLVAERTAAMREAQALLDATEDAVFIFDAHTLRFTYVNEGAARQLGCTREQLLGTSALDMKPPSAHSEFGRIIAQMLAGGSTSERFESVHQRADAQEVPVEINLQLVWSGRQAQRFIAVARDIRDRKKAEEKLREQAALLDMARDAIVVRDLEHRILFWNKSAERLYGWTTKEAVGRSLRELLLMDSTTLDEAANATLQTGEWMGEFEKVAKNGQKSIIESRWTLVRAQDGQPKSILAIDSDVTEKKRLEAQFFRAQRMDSLGTLAGGVAHDLNNALSPILMSLDLLAKECPGQADILDALQSSARRSAEIVRQLLTFAKGAEGTRVSVQPIHLLQELQGIMKATFPKNILVKLSYNPALPLLHGDATQLHQVLVNLCVNARDAMPQGGELHLEAEIQDVDAAYARCVADARPGRYVVFRVRDSGIGMTSDVLDRIFEPFFTTKDADCGTGLGLATALGIVRAHGGFIHAYSQPGKGSTFAVYLPPDHRTASAEPFPEVTRQFRGQGELILLVDDEDAVREIGCTVLQRLNCKPITAADGAQALAQVAVHRAELKGIITDLHMPHLNGLAFVRSLRYLLPHIPVAVASGRIEQSAAEEFTRLGVKLHLAKPFLESELMQALEKMLEPTDADSPPAE